MDSPSKCDMFWVNPRTLLVSWPHVFHVCSLRDRRTSSTVSLSSGGMLKLPNFELVISKLIHTDFAIAGIGPYVDDQYVLLGYNAGAKEEDRKVQMRIVKPRWEEFEDITCDELPVRGALYATYEDYKLQSLPEDGKFEHQYSVSTFSLYGNLVNGPKRKHSRRTLVARRVILLICNSFCRSSEVRSLSQVKMVHGSELFFSKAAQ